MSASATTARVTPSVSEFRAVIRESVVNTPYTKTLRLDLDAPASYRAGQYVTIDPHQFAELRSIVGSLEQLKRRREAPRAYSLSSAPDEPCVAITVKEEVFDPSDAPFRSQQEQRHRDRHAMSVVLRCGESMTERMICRRLPGRSDGGHGCQ